MDEGKGNLVWSLKNGDLDEVKRYLEQNPNVDLNALIDGRRAIHYASDYGHKDVIQYLLSKGADVNAMDKHGISPVLAAIWEGHTDCVQLMIDQGAKLDGMTPDGKPYVEATEKQDIIRLLKA